MKVSGWNHHADTSNDRWWWPICPVHNLVPKGTMRLREKKWSRKHILWLYCDGQGWHDLSGNQIEEAQ